MSQTLKLNIIRPGLHTTIQDHGRKTYRAFGIPVSGPMDLIAATQANLLLGNPPHNPVLEFTIVGPDITLEGNGYGVLTGGEFETRLDQKPLTTHQVFTIKGTHRLSIGRVQAGCRGYLAAAGNWELSRWLGSCSTAAQNPDLLTPGSYIKKGTTITVLQSGPMSFPLVAPIVEPDSSPVIRILAGPEYDRFGTETIKEFLAKQFAVSSESNRMGYRLNPLLQNYSRPMDIISAGVIPGTIQVTHSGQLIILMNDAQTTGGYPRIANVVSGDLSRLGQKAPGDQVKFKLISLNEINNPDLSG